MRKYKNIQMLAALLMAGTAFTACTNDDFADKATPQQGKTYTLSVNATKGADTRTLTEETDGSLTATWNLDDEVAVYLDGEKVGTLKPDNTEANALLTGDVTGVTVGDELDLVFSSDNYNSQEGTLEYIDTNCNYAKATVTVNAIVGDAVKTSNAVFENQQSITKFTFNKEVSEVVIDYGDDAITVTPAAATSTLYVAIPATIGEADFTFTATVDGKTYKGEKSATLEKGKFYTASIELSADLDDYIDLSADATANTYMVTAAGNYKFKATVKGNGGIDPITGTTATPITGIAGVKVLWELKEQGLAIKYADDAYDIFYSDGYVYFSTPDTFTSGDAYVAVYDSEGTILWSWLIWATGKPSETVYNGLTIMDRNLAAIGTGNVECRGLMYEWGRKDPFPSPNNGTYTPNSFAPSNGEIFKVIHTTTGETVEYSVQNPTTYFGWWNPAFWQTEDEFTLDMWWKGEKTIYDPCPPGWKVPSKEEMERVYASGVNLPGNGFIGNAQNPFTSSVYGNPGSWYYWTSTGVDHDHAWGWYGSSSYTHVDNHTASAYSIRPVKDQTTPVDIAFSVSASKKVAFAPGNLQYVNGEWGFAPHQYDYFGESQNDNQRDLFSYKEGYTYSCPSPWRVLTQSEWDYVLNTRSVTNSLSSGARYTMATLGEIKGMIIFPDDYSHPDGTGFSAGTFNASSDYTATVTLEGWEKMETAGAIFLPAAGYYTFNASEPTYKEIGLDGTYYSTTPHGEGYYYALYFSGIGGYKDCDVWTADDSWSDTRRSIRPVQDLN